MTSSLVDIFTQPLGLGNEESLLWLGKEEGFNTDSEKGKERFIRNDSF